MMCWGTGWGRENQRTGKQIIFASMEDGDKGVVKPLIEEFKSSHTGKFL